MNIELKEITVRQLSEGYQDNEEAGVIGYGGKLDIRPPYQREFIYKDKQRDAVINTVTKDFPLNVMYWAVRDDGNYEVIDGQQRTISLCHYVNGDFAYLFKYIHNLQEDEKDKILDYKLMVYICSGTDSEKLEWFRTINIAGEKLTEQELRNAVYSGSWVTDAKRYFSKNGCPAYQIGSDYLNGSAIRQDYFETAIKWISEGNIEVYMSNHQHDANALALWQYFQSVITWVEGTFTKKRTKFMKGVDWGTLYNKYKDEVFDTKSIEKETADLIADDEVQKKKGIYPYLLTRDERHLGIRAFTDSQKQKKYEQQKGICVECKDHFDIAQMEGDHITPWHENGKTVEENLQMLCKDCNRRKSGK
ncbi:DUF262 domain-containing protein [Maribacter sp.]|uniref:GmrSD restriction endonuclease domain-containing protein n=1 Tax=Maribacter sp. TaxID=1897614 RepID=UPI0025BD0018|nr:DUF262 domain-containing protein [Maribacter sp.]|tara:strand:- start:5485 stop:6570 length:1086 start_codon:yes stop_codon:yes gene_type:complete